MRAIRLISAAMILVASMCFLPSVQAACSKAKICSLHSKGVETSEIADACEMEEDDVDDVVSDCKAKRKGTPKGGEDTSTPRQAVCCDAFGNGRCPIVSGSTQIGDGCFCPGQGYGRICR